MFIDLITVFVGFGSISVVGCKTFEITLIISRSEMELEYSQDLHVSLKIIAPLRMLSIIWIQAFNSPVA